MTLPTTAAERKATPICTGFVDYFGDAMAVVAQVSKVGNDQHNPGQPLHWAKEKSTDHADCIMRHLIDRGTTDTDGIRHTAKVAWRAMALLQTELDAERAKAVPESRWGFTTGEIVNTTGSAPGKNPGVVRGFDDGRIYVEWEWQHEDCSFEDLGLWDPTELRHGA